MEIISPLGFFLWICSLQVLLLAEDGSKSRPDLGFHFPDIINFHKSNNNVKFFLYNREIITEPDIYIVSAHPSNLLPRFKNIKPLKVIIHGWLGKGDKYFSIDVTKGFLNNEDVNVITVDWFEYGAKHLLYPVARYKVPDVATIVAEFLDFLHRLYGVKLEEVHVLGHSLGAHIAGIAGYKVTTGKIGRITGLDPAGPFFRLDKLDERLSEKSAIFVDVIHTCAKFLGFNDPIGHADFYPNSGNFMQPGCGLDFSGLCSHRRGYNYYIESLTNKKAFPAVPCSSWDDYMNDKESCEIENVVYMGEGLLTSTRGVYYLKTNKHPPFGLGEV